MKNALTRLLLCLLAFFTTANADAQGWQWARQIVNTPFVVSSSQAGLATDTSGNIISATIISGFSTLLVGVTSTFGTYSVIDSANTSQVIITKTDRNGNVLWATASQHTGTGITNITTDKEGNAYILGVYDSTNCTFGNYPLSHAPLPAPCNTMYFIAKINPAGSVVWTKNIVPTSSFGYGGGTMAMMYVPVGSIKADDSGHLYVTGTFNTPSITIGTTTLPLSGLQSIFIAKYDTSGNPLWAKTYGSTGTDYVRSIELTKNGQLYMAGNYYSSSISFGPYTISNGADKGTYLAKFDNGGNALWAKTTDSFMYMRDLAVDTAANVYVCGNFSADSVNFDSHWITNTSIRHSDGFIVKYNDAGTVLWAKSMGGDSSDKAEKIALDNCGNVFITGSSSYFYTTPGGYYLHFDDDTRYLGIQGPLSYPMFIAQYNDAGQFLNCFGRYGGGANPALIATDNKGSFFINTQHTNTPDTFGTNVLVRDSGQFYQFLAKFDYDSSGCIPYTFPPVLKVIEQSVVGVSLFPNPATIEFFLQSDIEFQTGSATIITDMMGRQISVTPLSGKRATISTNALAPGLYNCIINMQGAGILYKKVVIVQ